MTKVLAYGFDFFAIFAGLECQIDGEMAKSMRLKVWQARRLGSAPKDFPDSSGSLPESGLDPIRGLEAQAIPPFIQSRPWEERVLRAEAFQS